MDIRHMRYFLAVAEELNFRRAAERLHLSQPPLSMQIKAMEEEVGATLFDRTQRNVKLTAAGEFLLPHVRETVARFDQTLELAKLAARGEAGRLRVGFTASVPLRQSFPQILRRFRALFPHVLLEVFHSSTANQLEMLKLGTLDVGFIRLPSLGAKGNLRLDHIWRDELELFAAADSKHAKSKTPIPIEALADENFVAFATQASSFEHVSILCREAGFTPKVVQQGRDASAILGFVAASVGVAILPNVYHQTGVSGVISRALTTPKSKSAVVLASREGQLSSLVSQFRHIAIEAGDKP